MLQTLLAFAFTAAAAVLAAPCPASFQIHPNGNTAYCLTVSGTRDNPGIAFSAPCEGMPRQEFKFETDPYSDVHHIRTFDAVPGGLCLAAEVYRVSGAYNGRQLALSGCYNDGAQGWSQSEYGGPIVMQGTVDGRQVCMDVRDGEINGGVVQIWYCYEGNTNQRWTISPWP